MTQLETSQDQIAALGPWFHNLHLPDGRQTAPFHPLGDFPNFLWQQIAPAIPADLTGWSVLDIGCNAGFYSFELAKRGASVLAVDLDEHYLQQARWAAQHLGLSNIEFRQMQIYDLARLDSQFDLVWFMGVFYHLRYPLLGLDIAARKVKKWMIFQTMTLPGDEIKDPPLDVPLNEREQLLAPGWPTMAFIEKRLAGDPTNWWAANRACVEAMLRSCGLESFQRIGAEVHLCRLHDGRHSEIPELREQEYLAATGQSKT